MKKRATFNPKRSISKSNEGLDLVALSEFVRYSGNPEHKRNPGDFGLTPPSQPRADKTLCDAGKLTISFNWLPREYGNIIERLTFADLFISADSLCLTELADQLAKTVRRGPRVSLYLLAQWFVANWWRLRWEPERPKELSWLMSHKIGAAGSGYCWPDLSFCSDGWAVAIHGQPAQAMESQMVRYLQSVDINIPALEFEQEVDSFVDAMINRLASEAPAETELANLWKEVLQERRDPQLTEWRKLEAFLGYDPDEAIEALADQFIVSPPPQPFFLLSTQHFVSPPTKR